jgi:hypothetical protein
MPHEETSSSSYASTHEVTAPTVPKCTIPANVTNNGGGSMTGGTVSLIPVFWGPAVTSITPANVENFYGALAHSATPYLSWLASEYTTAPVAAGGPVIITPDGYSTDAPQTVTDAQVQQELNRQFGKPGVLPCQENAIYLVHMPKNVTAVDQKGEVQCSPWCGYHRSYSSPFGVVHYAIIPDLSDTTQCVCSTPTIVESHEIAETLTNPDPDTGSGWRDDAQALCGGEVGDICVGYDTTILDQLGTSWPVQKLWSRWDTECVTAAQLPVISSLSPASGPNGGGTIVTVTGERFAVGANATTFSFGGVTAPSSNCSSSTSCQVTTPAYVESWLTVQVHASVGPNTSAWDGAQDNFAYTAGPTCTPAYSCAGLSWGYPNDTVTCPTPANFSYGTTPGEVPLGSGVLSATYPTGDLGAFIFACDPTSGSCSKYTTDLPSTYAAYCGSEPSQPPTFCQECVKQGGHCGRLGSRQTCVFQ